MARSKSVRRKLQFAGNSSYVVTLPKWWITKIGLDKNSEVIIEENLDGSLIIKPNHALTEPEEEDEIILWVSKNDSPGSIIRRILASYLASYNRIVIAPKEKELEHLPAKIILATNAITNKLWGAEIIEEKSDRLVIQDALNLSQMSIDEIVQKAWFTAFNMMNLAETAVFEDEKDAVLIVNNSENTMDRLYYLALRQLYKASKNGIFAQEIGIFPSDVIDYHLLIKHIERMADHCDKIVRSVSYSASRDPTLRIIYQETRNACSDSVKAFQRKDSQLAEKAIETKERLLEKIALIPETLEDFPLRKSILRLGDYASDISELVINRRYSLEL